MGKKLRKLTKKQKRFADEYIISGNSAEAARKAGYSEKTARSIGSENLTKPNIKKYVDERLEELEAEKYLSMEEALKITASIARGEPKTVRGYDHELGMEFEQEVYPDFKDQKGALEHFFKIQGAFSDKGMRNVNIEHKRAQIKEIKAKIDGTYGADISDNRTINITNNIPNSIGDADGQ